MNKQKEALRLITTTDMSNRMIGRSLHLSHNTIRRYRGCLKLSKLNWEFIKDLDDSQIEDLLQSNSHRVQSKIMPDWAAVHREMQYRGVTLQLLWEEYRLANPKHSYAYSQFTHYYRQYLGKIDLTMRQDHRAGECTYVDFAGRTIPYTDLESGEEKNAQIFVGVIACSNYPFVCAVKSQALPHWIEAHNRMFEFFGGTTQVIIPDNLKSAVTRAGREPEINRTYLDLAKHYEVVIIPARVRRPKDKAKAELTVKLVYRWILARLRHQKFFSIEEINAAMAELLKLFIERPFKRLPGSRRSRFEELDKPLLRPLPAEPFEFSEWTSPQKLRPDYHVCVRDHYYSVPHALVGSRIEARVTAKIVELFHKGRRVACHHRSHEIGAHTTNPDHQPIAHRRYAEQKPKLIKKWAKSIGPSTEAVIQHQFESRPHALLAIRASASLQRLAKDYGNDRFEAACNRAVQIDSPTVKSVRSILQRGLDAQRDESLSIQVNLPFHNNLRGAEYYADGGQ
ncbi:MAG: IS21 family transposase [Candidatus Thiodiazotropha sp. (ex Monitilora ramsayi)]|nr:IS21 family transposase [Candidatus Thiodiazotropha sp. (ex Monitilora ramsayi)]